MTGRNAFHSNSVENCRDSTFSRSTNCFMFCQVIKFTGDLKCVFLWFLCPDSNVIGTCTLLMNPTKLQSVIESAPLRLLFVKISHSRPPASPVFLFCSSLHFRKRIQGFCLLCVSVWLLRGPWCQLRWSAQCICGNRSQHVTTQCRWIHHTVKS